MYKIVLDPQTANRIVEEIKANDEMRVCNQCDTVYGDWRQRCPNCGTARKGARHHQRGSTN